MANGIKSGEQRDAAKYPIIHRTLSYSKEVFDPTHQ